MGTSWFFLLRFRRAYDSGYHSDLQFLLGRKRSYVTHVHFDTMFYTVAVKTNLRIRSPHEERISLAKLSCLPNTTLDTGTLRALVWHMMHFLKGSTTKGMNKLKDDDFSPNVTRKFYLAKKFWSSLFYGVLFIIYAINVFLLRKSYTNGYSLMEIELICHIMLFSGYFSWQNHLWWFWVLVTFE